MLYEDHTLLLHCYMDSTSVIHLF